MNPIEDASLPGVDIETRSARAIIPIGRRVAWGKVLSWALQSAPHLGRTRRHGCIFAAGVTCRVIDGRLTTQENTPLPTELSQLSQWLPPAAIIALMIYLHRSTHRRLDRLEAQVGDLRDRMETQIGDLRDRMGKVEGTLTALRDFFVRAGRGTAA